MQLVSPTRTHYDVLGCRPDATAKELRRAYLQLARRHHPDFHVGDDAGVRKRAEIRMQQVNAAWHVLSDTGRRRAYDTVLNGGSGRPRPPGAGPHRPYDTWHAYDDGLDDFDPADFDDTPYDDGRGVPPLLSVAPVLLLLGAAVLLGAALLFDLRALVAAAAVVACLGVAAFVIVPLVALTRSRRGSGL